MRIIIKNSMDHFFSYKLLLCFFVFSFYSMHSRINANINRITYWEYVINVISDHYYIVYFMLLFFIFTLFGIFNDEEELVVTRFSSFVKYFSIKVASCFFISSIFVFLHLVIAFIMGIGLKFNTFFTKTNEFDDSVLVYFSNYFFSPILTIVLIVFYMIIGLSFLGTIFLFLRHFLNKKYVLIIFSIMYFLSILSINSDIDLKFPYFFINNYFILHHSIASLSKNYYLFFLFELVALGMIHIVIKKFWFHSFYLSFSNLLKNMKLFLIQWNISLLSTKRNVITIFLLLSISFLSIQLQYHNASFFDMLFFQFFGHGTESFYIKDFTNLLIYNGLPIFILGYFLEKESTETSLSMLIRLKNKNIWFISIIRTASLFISTYIILTLGICTIITVCFGSPLIGFKTINDLLNTINIESVSSSYLILIILTSKFLDLLLQFFILFLVFCYTNNSASGFVLLLILNIVPVIGPSYLKVIPIGSSSLSRMSEFIGDQGVPFPLIISILFLSTFFIYFALKRAFKKRLFS